MKTYLPRLMPFILSAFIMGSAQAQISLEDLDLEKDISSWYDDNAGPEILEIFEGKIFNVKINTSTSQTFSAFKSARWIDGEIYFRGELYKEIPMKYDLYSDQLTVLNIAGSPLQPIVPNQVDIVYFNLDGDLFLNLSDEEAPEGVGGIYHILYSGEGVRLLAKRVKRQVVEGRQLQFVTSDKVFIQSGDQFTRLKSKKSFFLAFAAYKSEIKSFTSSRGLRIKPTNENSLITLIQYCESLIAPK